MRPLFEDSEDINNKALTALLTESPNKIVELISTADGSGSGLDADTLDGKHLNQATEIANKNTFAHYSNKHTLDSTALTLFFNTRDSSTNILASGHSLFFTHWNSVALTQEQRDLPCNIIVTNTSGDVISSARITKLFGNELKAGAFPSESVFHAYNLDTHWDISTIFPFPLQMIAEGSNGFYDPVPVYPSWYLQAMMNTTFPVGTYYTQYPTWIDTTVTPNVTHESKTPSNMHFPGVWQLMFATEGVFFRTAGGNASAFNSGIQSDEIKAHTHTIKTSVTNLAIGTQPIEHIHLVTDLNTSSTGGVENRTINRTIQVWRRIS